MTVRDEYIIRFMWPYFLKKKGDAHKMFEQVLADIRDHGEVGAVRSDNGGEFTG